jgi:hypothetical protein
MMKHFYQESKFYVSVALPVLATLIAGLDDLLVRHDLPVSSGAFAFLAKGTALLVAVYVAGKSYENGQLLTNVTPPPSVVAAASAEFIGNDAPTA